MMPQGRSPMLASSLVASRFVPAAFVSMLVLGTGACGGSDGESEGGEPPLLARSLVGQVDDSDVVLGVVVEDDDVTIYACGGVDTHATHSRWFAGRFGEGDDPDAFSIELDGFRIAGQRSSEAIAGSLRDPDGTMRSFTVAPTDEDGLSGLYWADVDGCRTGVVLFATPEGIDGQGTYCNDTGEFIQVIILQPVALQANGVEVQVDKPEGPTSFFVQPF